MAKKIKSKRLTTRHRAKVVRKVAEHRRKMRKASKDNNHGKKAGQKDPGVPREMPGRDEFVERMRRERELEKEQRKARRLLKEGNNDGSKSSSGSDPSKRAYFRELKQVVEASDVLLEVLDARDPAGYGVKELEQSLLEMGKKVVVVLNKADLVPRSVVEGWIKVIQREYPCLAFKAQGSTYAKNINNESLLASGDDVVQLLKNYSRSKDIKTTITVGVIGYPNVGKSSLINALKRSKVCKVGATPGVTTSGQEVHLDKNIRLIDCPGVVFGGKDNETLVNCVKVEQLGDPIEPVRRIVEKCPPAYLAQLYGISAFDSVDEFIQLCGQRLGKLKKGGVVDVGVTAKIILQDWNSGKIRYYVEPPALMDASAVIVEALAPEFKVEGRVGVVSSREDVGRDLVGNLVIGQQNSTKQDSRRIQKEDSMSTFEQSLNPQTNKLRQVALKKQKKQQLRAQSKSASKQSNSSIGDEESDVDMNEAFGAFKPLPQ